MAKFPSFEFTSVYLKETLVEGLYILPFHPSVLQETEEDEEIFDQSHIRYWRKVLEKLANGMLEWELFLSSFEGPLLFHPSAWLLTKKEGQSLLHLAVIDDQISVAEALTECSFLKTRKNHFGHTPIDLAHHLNRIEIGKILDPTPLPRFWKQPKVRSPERGKMGPLVELEYLPYPIFESVDIFNEVLFSTRRAKKEDEIPTEKVWMGIYYDLEIRQQLTPSVIVRFVDDEVGFGVFASQRIPACAFVGEYTGVVQERKKQHLKDKYYCIRYPTWVMGKRHFVIDAERKGNFTRFINHSTHPNLSLQSVLWKGMPRMIFVAMEEINCGEQLTFDYGNVFWKECCQVPKIF